jgi:hypothetical protein
MPRLENGVPPHCYPSWDNRKVDVEDHDGAFGRAWSWAAMMHLGSVHPFIQTLNIHQAQVTTELLMLRL